MKTLAIALFVCGVWFLWSAVKLDAEMQETHRGSMLRLLERDAAVSHDPQVLAAQLNLAIREGERGYGILERAVLQLALSGGCLFTTAVITFLSAQRRPNQSTLQTPASVMPAAGAPGAPPSGAAGP